MPDDNGLVIHRPAEDRLVEEARARLMQARQRTRDALAALRSDLSEQTDWHTWYRARPAVFIAAAFVAGFLFGRRR